MRPSKDRKRINGGVPGRAGEVRFKKTSPMDELDEGELRVVVTALEEGGNAQLVSKRTGIEVTEVRKMLRRKSIRKALSYGKATNPLSLGMIKEELRDIALDKGIKASTRVNALNTGLRALGVPDQVTNIEVKVAQQIQNLTLQELLEHVRAVNPNAPIDEKVLAQTKKQTAWFSGEKPLEVKKKFDGIEQNDK